MGLGLPAWIQTKHGTSLLLLLLGALFWFPAIHDGTVSYDTPWLVVNNPILSSGDFGYLSMIWTDWDLGTRRTLGSEYLPVRDTSVLIDFWAFGDSWRAHHAVNLFWYLMACLVFHRLLIRWFNDLLIATSLAALFLVHPVHVESVVWLASRKDVISLFFFMASIGCWERHQKDELPWLLNSAACMWLACWSKNTAIVLPGVLFVLALGKDRNAWRKRAWWAQWIPYAFVLVIVVWMSLRVGEQVGMFREPWADSHLQLLSLQLSLIVQYSLSLIWPMGLSAVYELPSPSWQQPGPWIGGLIVGAMVWMGTRYQKKSPLIAVGLGVFLICLAPVSAWMSLQNLQADRYLLLPSAGLVMAIGGAFSVSGMLRQHGVLVLALGSIVLGLVTQNRCRVWHNSEALWRSAVEEQPGRVTGWSNLAGALLEEQRRIEAEKVLEEGLTHHPNHPALNQSLCLVRYTPQSEPWTQAESDCRAALEEDPTRMIAGKVLTIILIRTERPQEALEVSSQLVRSRPGYEGGWIVHGRAYMQLDLPAEAIGAFHRAWQINPYNAVTALRLAKASEMIGDVDGSVVWAQRALELEPENPGALARIRKLKSH